MPILRMSEVAWDTNRGMLTNGGGGHGGQDMAGMRQHAVATRSQDDARVGYFFQRPQTDAELINYGNKRWAPGDDSIIEQVSSYFQLSTLFSSLNMRNKNSFCGSDCFDLFTDSE